jgi:hypothetical protein
MKLLEGKVAIITGASRMKRNCRSFAKHKCCFTYSSSVESAEALERIECFRY